MSNLKEAFKSFKSTSTEDVQVITKPELIRGGLAECSKMCGAMCRKMGNSSSTTVSDNTISPNL